ncbi:MAG: hypothetical protein NTV08_18000 [Verrucomicrobia bacterium]|nr:hypothetical protein [Verrucomicrobiota bacterium]
MTLNRRSFLGLGSLVACGTALNAPFLMAAAPRAAAGALPLCAGGKAVLEYVRSYSSNFRAVDAPGSDAGGRRKLHLLAEVADVKRWPAAMARVPFTKVRAGGNTLAFAIEGLDVTIENLTPEVFGARLASLG